MSAKRIGRLTDHRLEEDRTCMACRKAPANDDGLWCTECANRIHKLDANDKRELDEK